MVAERGVTSQERLVTTDVKHHAILEKSALKFHVMLKFVSIANAAIDSLTQFVSQLLKETPLNAIPIAGNIKETKS